MDVPPPIKSEEGSSTQYIECQVIPIKRLQTSVKHSRCFFNLHFDVLWTYVEGLPSLSLNPFSSKATTTAQLLHIEILAIILTKWGVGAGLLLVADTKGDYDFARGQ